MKVPPRTLSRKLSVEQLEDRLTPTWGIPWPSPTTLTLSFVPDGTNVSGTPSNLFALLGPNTSVWETEILQAYQTWAIESNINIGLVSDDGAPWGAPVFWRGIPATATSGLPPSLSQARRGPWIWRTPARTTPPQARGPAPCS